MLKLGQLNSYFKKLAKLNLAFFIIFVEIKIKNKQAEKAAVSTSTLSMMTLCILANFQNSACFIAFRLLYCYSECR